jgi:hypothetical protein
LRVSFMWLFGALSCSPIEGERPLPSSIRIGITFGITFSAIFSIMAVKQCFCQTAKYPCEIDGGSEKALAG